MADERQLALRDEVFVEAEIDGSSVALEAVVTNILPDAFWLALPLADGRLMSMTPGQPVDLCFDRPGGAMVLHSAFVRRLGGERLGTEKSRVFAVARPPGLDTAERRADLRVALDRGVRIRVPSAAAPRRYAIGSGRTVNIGAGGLQLTTDLPLAVGQEVVLALALSSRAIVMAGAQVTRIGDEPCPGAEEGRVAAGEGAQALCAAFRFTRITESDRERIACHILAARRSLPVLRAVMAMPADGAGDTAPARGAADPAEAAEPAEQPAPVGEPAEDAPVTA